jgi:GNAT superfamily N-acetyltransferase
VNLRDPRILQHWATTLHVPPEAFHEPGLFVHFDMDQDDRIIVYSAGETQVVFAPPRFQSIGKPDGTENLAAWLGAPLSLKWRDLVYYATRPQPAPAAALDLRALGPEDAPLLADLQAQCSARELELAQISMDDLSVTGWFAGDRLAGVASLLQTTPDIFDIGVLTHPDARGRGIGVALTTHLRNLVTGRGDVAQYTTMESNRGSVRVAKKCGFDLFVLEEGYAIGAG